MLLVIDAGNTNIVFAVHDGAEWRGTWRLATSSQRTSDEYGVWLEALIVRAGIKVAQIEGAVIGTVVPAALYHLRRLCRDWFDVEPIVARAALDWGFEIKTDNPEEVGADRLLNALAAHTRTVPISAASSRRGSICRLRHCTSTPPGCRASASAGRNR